MSWNDGEFLWDSVDAVGLVGPWQDLRFVSGIAVCAPNDLDDL